MSSQVFPQAPAGQSCGQPKPRLDFYTSSISQKCSFFKSWICFLCEEFGIVTGSCSSVCWVHAVHRAPPCRDVLCCLTPVCSSRLHVFVAPEVYNSFVQPGFVQEANLSWKGFPGGQLCSPHHSRCLEGP